MESINIKKVEWSMENGTEEERNELLAQIYQVNMTAESIWLRSKLKNPKSDGNQKPSAENVKPKSDGNQKPSAENAKPKSDGYKKPSVENTVPNENPSVEKPKIKLNEIGGGRSAKKSYYDEKGYVYGKSNSSENAHYFRCKNRQFEKCNARVICTGKDLDNCVLSQPHSHDPNQSSLDRAKFSKKIEEICLEFPLKKSQEIYNDAKKALRGHIDMSHIPERERFDTFIHRKLKIHVPLLAKTIEEFERLINDPKYSPLYTCDEQKKLFYRGVWRGSTGANVVFLSETVLQEVRNLPTKNESLTLLMDGTFKSLPLHIKFRQLYIINVIIEERSYPLAYILMTKRDTKSYELIFNNLKSLFPSVNVECCMSDYEAATRKAIKIVFPTARLAGCYFHYVQGIVKAFKKFGLKKDEKFKNARQQVSALALLPNEFVTPGFEIISKMFNKSVRWSRFADYWMRQWAPANISVYGLKDRTNNFAESLNKTINSILKAPHPHIWLLIENLRMVEMNRSDELIKVVAGHMVKTVKDDDEEENVNPKTQNSKSQKIKKLNEKIRNATVTFDKTQNVGKFLRNVTFDENLESYFKERISIDVDDSGNEDDDGDEDFDELIIPNDLNIESNFRKQFPRAVLKRKNECHKTVEKKQKP